MNRVITSTILDENKLQHHGVKGMKWGVRKEPETKSKNSNVTINSLETRLNKMGVRYISNISEKSESREITKLKDAKKIRPPETYEDSVKNVNPIDSIDSITANCVNSTMAYELRRRGYDVKASQSLKGPTLNEILKSYNNPINREFYDVNNPSRYEQTTKELHNYFNSIPNGGRGAIVCIWDNDYSTSGHIYSFERVDGKTMFIDSQIGKQGEFKNIRYIKEPTLDPADYMSRSAAVSIFRTDDCIINEEYLKGSVMKG